MPIPFTHEDHARDPFKDRERIQKLVLDARAHLKPLYYALEDELVDAATRGDDPALAIIAWLYGPVSALISDIEITFGDLLP